MASDVIIVGGGPAGLHLSRRVAEMGYSTLLIDDRHQIGLRKICTGIIGADAFQELDLPTQPILSEIRELRFVSPSGQTLDYRHESVLAKVVDRTRFDAELAEAARAAGVQVRCGFRVANVSISANGVTAEAFPVAHVEEKEALRARFLVVATGVGSRLHRRTELGSAVEFLNAVQAHIRVRDFPKTLCFTGRDVAPGAFAWLVPLGNGWGRIGLMSDRRAGPYFQHFLRQLTEFRTDDELVAADYKPIVQRFSGPSYGHRVLAVGEAAGQVKTTTGGGIYCGLLGAEIGAAVVHECFSRNRFDAQFLGRYEER